MAQLPGIASQRLMAKGYGFGGEGDWKTAALVRAMKVMGTGLQGGNSFMEDYTYHFNPSNKMVLGAHMLEICESIADAKPNCEIHPLGIGGKADPVRLVFNSAPGPALNASIVDMGNRFRLLINEVKAVAPVHELPKLPVARVLWQPYPNMHVGCAAWIYAGGAHHTCYSQNLTSEHLEDFAAMAGIEFLLIGKETSLHQFKKGQGPHERGKGLFKAAVWSKVWGAQQTAKSRSQPRSRKKAKQ
jgi:L-arabinose isomerase